MYSGLIYNILKSIKQLIKLVFIYQKIQNKLNLGDNELYMNDAKITSIMDSKKENLIKVASSQLARNIYMPSIFF